MTKPGTTAWLGIVAVAAAAMLAGCEQGQAGKPVTQKTAAPAAKANPAATSEAIYPAKTSLFALGGKNFVTDWLVLGPITFDAGDFKGDQQQDATDHEFVTGEGALDGSQPAPAGAKWQARSFRPGPKGDAGQVDLDGLYGAPDYAVAYAVAWVACAKDLDALKLCVGSDDYVKVWINGTCVHTYKTERRASDWDQDVVPNVSLKKGLNRIVVKCVDIVVDWDFYLRFTDAKDKAMEFRGPAAAK